MRTRRRRPTRRLATVLFTDIAGSTEAAARLGDRRWGQLLAAHHALVRKHLKRFGGREVDTAGDGFLATFDFPAQAVECARAITHEATRLGIEVRAGIHMGEYEAGGSKPVGIAVHTSARVLGLAVPGEVVVTSIIKDLVAGSDLAFEDRGTHQLKGVPGEWRLYALRPDATEAHGEEEADSASASRTRWLAIPVAASIAIAAALLAGTILRNEEPRRSPGATAVGTSDEGGVLRVDLTSRGIETIHIPDMLRRLGTATVHKPRNVVVGFGSVWVGTKDGVVRIDPNEDGIPHDSIGVANGVNGLATGFGHLWLSADLHDQTRILFLLPKPEVVSAIGKRLRYGSHLAAGEGAVWVPFAAGYADRAQTRIARIEPGKGFTDEELIMTGKVDVDVVDHGNAIAAGEGSVWAATPQGTVAKIDPRTTRVVDETRVRDATGVAADFGAVWVTNGETADPEGILTKIDARTGERISSKKLGLDASWVTTGEGSVWVADDIEEVVRRVDPVTLEVQDTFELPEAPQAIAVGEGSLWATFY